jgi:hypothetical protein
MENKKGYSNSNITEFLDITYVQESFYILKLVFLVPQLCLRYFFRRNKLAHLPLQNEDQGPILQIETRMKVVEFQFSHKIR